MNVAWVQQGMPLLAKLNRNSWRRSFCPEADLDWQSETTADEFRRLYDQWSLLLGSRHEATLNDTQRIRFAKYQQMNLMLITALFERHALPNFERLYEQSDHPAYQEYVAHLIKEETYHTVLFSRAIARISESDPALEALPCRHLKVFLGLTMTAIRLTPIRRLRNSLFFSYLRFAEEITMHAHTMTRRTVPRRASLVRRVWALHALDEARHLAFNDLMLQETSLPDRYQKFARWMVTPLCVATSLLLNLNEIWAARKVGVYVAYRELPRLMKQTTAPFKRGVFRLLFDHRPSTRRPTP